jgi:Cu+-exporting ATPase
MSNRKVALPIIDLSCGSGGAMLIERLLTNLPGVVDVYVNPATETAYVEYEPAEVSEEQFGQAIRSAGYKSVLPARVLREAGS